MVTNPSGLKGPRGELKALEHEKENDWKKSEDPLLQALASIEENDEFREQYRKSLEKLLGDKPSIQQRKKILENIKSDYTPDKLERYRELIKTSRSEKLRPGSLPWPICIPFGCCR
jgi:hypothetical protein